MLVIIGLLVGGVVAGQSMLRGASINSVGIELTSIADNVLKFKKQYGAFPGDMTDATNYWGTAHGTPATCRTTTTGDKRTCNGDGDGMIEYWAAGSNEEFRVWQHLANAGFLDGNYSGISDSSTVDYDATPGVNVPEGPLKKSGFAFWSNPNSYVGSSSLWDYEGSVFLQFGGEPNPNSWRMGNYTLTPKEQKSLDDKYDDGLPQSGIITTTRVASDCVTTTDATTSRYRLTFEGVACYINMPLVRYWNKGL